MNMDARPPLPSPAFGDCRNCGQPLPLGATFCPNCGASVATGQAGQGLSPWRILGAVCLGCLGLVVGGFGACIALVMGLDSSSFDPSMLAVIIPCLAVAGACIFGFIKLIKKP